jgi:hypothetical protein
MKRTMVLFAACFALAASGCGSNDDDGAGSSSDQAPQPNSGVQEVAGHGKSTLPQGSEPVDLDPAKFTTRIDNPYWTMTPGTKWIYRGAEGGGNQRIEVTVTKDTKKIDGVTARVVRDVVSEDGKLIELTYDWYAQDTAGNVWYLGEDTAEYENGKVATRAGSWESGVDGAQGGIIMPGDPKPGLSYRQEYYKGKAEDEGRILSLNESVKVPFGNFQNALETADTTPLEPKILEHKYYAKGVGPVLKVGANGGGREELLSLRRPQ